MSSTTRAGIMQLNAFFPTRDIGTDPAADFGVAAIAFAF
jgi:hypothetical protein